MQEQKANIYVVLERQFRRTYDEANRLQGPTGEILSACSSSGSTKACSVPAGRRPACRHVNHGLIHVNGKRVDIASYRVRKGEVVSLSPKAMEMIVIHLAVWQGSGLRQDTVEERDHRGVITSLFPTVGGLFSVERNAGRDRHLWPRSLSISDSVTPK